MRKLARIGMTVILAATVLFGVLAATPTLTNAADQTVSVRGWTIVLKDIEGYEPWPSLPVPIRQALFALPVRVNGFLVVHNNVTIEVYPQGWSHPAGYLGEFDMWVNTIRIFNTEYDVYGTALHEIGHAFDWNLSLGELGYWQSDCYIWEAVASDIWTGTDYGQRWASGFWWVVDPSDWASPPPQDFVDYFTVRFDNPLIYTDWCAWKYDTNSDGVMTRSEYVVAYNDYLAGEILHRQAGEVRNLWLGQ